MSEQNYWDCALIFCFGHTGFLIWKMPTFSSKVVETSEILTAAQRAGISTSKKKVSTTFLDKVDVFQIRKWVKPKIWMKGKNWSTVSKVVLWLYLVISGKKSTLARLATTLPFGPYYSLQIMLINSPQWTLSQTPESNPDPLLTSHIMSIFISSLSLMFFSWSWSPSAIHLIDSAMHLVFSISAFSSSRSSPRCELVRFSGTTKVCKRLN